VRSASFRWSLVALSKRLISLGSALGKLTLQIGYELLEIGERAVGRRAHLRTFVGTDLPGGSYRDRHGPPQVVDQDDHRSVAE